MFQNILALCYYMLVNAELLLLCKTSKDMDKKVKESRALTFSLKGEHAENYAMIEFFRRRILQSGRVVSIDLRFSNIRDLTCLEGIDTV